MFFCKTLLLNPRFSHSLQRTISSNSPAQTISSLFANPSSKTTQITKPSPKNQNLHKDKKFVPEPKNRPMEENESSKYLSKNQKLRNEDEKFVPKPKNRSMEEKEFPKELSAEVTMLMSRLIGDGNLKDANFSKGQDLEPQKIPADFYSRHFLKTAAERFGRDHQGVAK